MAPCSPRHYLPWFCSDIPFLQLNQQQEPHLILSSPHNFKPFTETLYLLKFYELLMYSLSGLRTSLGAILQRELNMLCVTSFLFSSKAAWSTSSSEIFWSYSCGRLKIGVRYWKAPFSCYTNLLQTKPTEATWTNGDKEKSIPMNSYQKP